jgi:hypothetical protein
VPHPDLGASLIDARLQFHHAAQFATALGISYLTPQADDSHTNLGWDARLGALRSRAASGLRGPVSIAVQPADLTLHVMRDGSTAATLPLHGRTISAATDDIRAALADYGLDGARYTLQRHFEIPRHAVDDGAPFDTSRGQAFAEVAAWYELASATLEAIAAATPGASEVRTWPHHFDIATLVAVAPGRTTGAGMSPGDQSYGEPYFYVNAYPAPTVDRLTIILEGGGHWHTSGWTGAVLPGSRLTSDVAGQPDQVRAFLDSALAACRSLVLG